MISNKHFLSKTLFITAFVIIGCAISACSEDEAGTSGESATFISKLKSKKWVYNGYDVDLLEKQVITLYFINDTHGVEHEYYKFLDISNSTREYDNPFTYNISGDKIVIRYTKSGDSFTLQYAGNSLIWTSGEQIYYEHNYSTEDYAYIKKYDPTEQDKEKQIQKNVNNNLSVTVKQSEGGWLYTFNTSALERLYPSSKIEYGVIYSGVCNNYRYCKQSYCSEHEYYVYAKKDGSKYSALVYPCDPNEDNGEYQLYWETYTTLTEKINKGISLSGSEKDLYNSVKQYMDEFLDCNYDDTPFAKIDGKFYRLENFNISRCWYCHGFGFTYRKGTCSICKGSGK